jgi:photosystem II stability/assembly factor-like uncharacterized protein
MAQTSQEYFDAFEGAIWVQPDGPNTKPEPLLCADIDTIDEPRGDTVVRLCRAADGSWRSIKRSQGTPGQVTFDVVVNKAKQRSYLRKALERRCPIPIYIPHILCGRQDVFLNYSTMKVAKDGIVTTQSGGSFVVQRAEEGDTPDMVANTFSLMADPDSPEIYKLEPTVSNPASETEPLRDITSCSVPQCAGGPCGGLVDVCDEMHVVADATAYSTADGYVTANNAGSWTAWATSPFSVDDAIASIVCFMIDADTERLLVADGTPNGATAMQVAYSDDNGATWTTVTVGSTNNEYALHGGALFALDHRNIWLCTSDANVYFSADGGLTWTDQSAPAPAADEGLRYIHFIDENYGWAVGGYRTTPTGLFIQTVDGGEHWSLATAEPKVEMGNAVAVVDANNVWVALDDGTVYYTDDWGTTWTQRALPSTMTNISDIQFNDAYEGALCGYKAGTGNGVPTVMRTWDGGYDWEEYNHTTEFDSSVEHYGLNALQMCSINEIHAVGEAADSVSLVWTLKPSGW